MTCCNHYNYIVQTSNAIYSFIYCMLEPCVCTYYQTQPQVCICLYWI